VADRIGPPEGMVDMDSKEYFDGVSEQWDAMRSSFFSDNVRDVVMTTVHIDTGKVAADLGAGTGFITRGLIGSGLRVIAVDRSQAMIDEMKKKFGDRSEIEYRIAGPGRLPIADEEVDYVFANMFLHHVEDPGESIKEMARILKPGGSVIVSDLDRHDHEFLRKEQKDRWLGFDRKDIERWFLEAGFRNVLIESVGEDCCAESSCGCDKASVSIFVASACK
jgi:ubiquinone/menaquinone biosynthesis C-methylase UbiE